MQNLKMNKYKLQSSSRIIIFEASVHQRPFNIF